MQASPAFEKNEVDIPLSVFGANFTRLSFDPHT
jgi:hypothetical protein